MIDAKLYLMLRRDWSVLSASAEIEPMLGYAADDLTSGSGDG